MAARSDTDPFGCSDADDHEGHVHHVATSPPTACPACGETHDVASLVLVAQALRSQQQGYEVVRPTTASRTAALITFALALIGLWSVLAALWRTASSLWGLLL